jgi:hypothetical protein
VTRRLVCLGLLLAAVAIHVGVTRPTRRGRDEARDRFAAARAERERLRTDVARLERRASRPLAPEGDAAAARALRLSLLRATEHLPLQAVQISAEPQRRGTVAAHGRLAAEGTQADLLRAADRLADPASGLVLQRVQLLGGPSREPRLEVEALSVRAPAEVPAGSRGQAGS